MAKIIIIAPYPKGKAPSQRFRFEQYLPYLEKQGFEIDYVPFYNDEVWEVLYKNGHYFRKFYHVFAAFIKRFILLFSLKNYDHIFVHREMAPLGPPIFEFITAKLFKRKYIYDFDDAIWLANYSNANSLFQWTKAYWKVNYVMKWAYKISAGNDYLANYARKYNDQTQVVPTTIDTENYHTILTNHEEEPVVIGWTGSHSTMRYLDFIFPIIDELSKEFDFRFRVISDKIPDVEMECLDFIPWQKESEIEDLSKIHIGIMPLVEDPWSSGKCGFKGLQYMSLGIVALMSPVGVNNTIITHETNGFLVSTPEEWKACLRDLLQNPKKRKEIGQKGRERIVEAYSVLSQKEVYLELFE